MSLASFGRAYEAALNGAALLDRVCPGWYADIDLDVINMGDAENCILAQVFGGTFYTGMGAIGLPVSDAFGYGFDNSGGDTAYAVLAAAWADIISERMGY